MNLPDEQLIFYSRGLSDSLNKTQTQGTKQDKLFFFYAQKLLQSEKNLAESLLEQCEKLARQCEEIKVSALGRGADLYLLLIQILPEPEPPRTSSPAKEEQVKTDINISAVLSPEPAEQDEEKPPELDHSTVSVVRCPFAMSSTDLSGARFHFVRHSSCEQESRCRCSNLSMFTIATTNANAIDRGNSRTTSIPIAPVGGDDLCSHEPCQSIDE